MDSCIIGVSSSAVRSGYNASTLPVRSLINPSSDIVVPRITLDISLFTVAVGAKHFALAYNAANASPLHLTLMQGADRFFDAALAGLGCFCTFNRKDVTRFVAIRERVKEFFGGGILFERGSKIGGHGHFARRRIQFKGHIHGIATC